MKMQCRRLCAFKLGFRPKAPKYGPPVWVLYKSSTIGGFYLAKGPTLCGGKFLDIERFIQNQTPI